MATATRRRSAGAKAPLAIIEGKVAPDTDLTVSEIASLTRLDPKKVASALSGAARNTSRWKNVSRGVYRFIGEAATPRRRGATKVKVPATRAPASTNGAGVGVKKIGTDMDGHMLMLDGEGRVYRLMPL